MYKGIDKGAWEGGGEEEAEATRFFFTSTTILSHWMIQLLLLEHR